MELQEIATYLILTGTVLYFIVKAVRIFATKKVASSCATGGCSDCDVTSNCSSEQ